MNQGFLAGVAWGSLVAGLGLAVISQVAPGLSEGDVVVAVRSTGEVGKAPVADPTPPAKLPNPQPEPEPQPIAEPEAPSTATAPDPSTGVPPAEPAAPDVRLASQPPEGPETVDSAARPAIPALTAAMPPAPEIGGGPALSPAPASGPRVASDVPPLAGDEALLAPPPAPAPTPAPARVALAQDPVAQAKPQPQTPPQTPPSAPDAAPVLPVVRPVPVPETGAEPDPTPPTAAESEPAQATDAAPLLQPVRPIIADDTPRRLAPDPGLAGTDGVRVGQLPRIGDPVVAAESPAASADAPPVMRFARAFDNPDAKPLFAILLRDTGAADLDRAALAQISFPVTFVIDPMLPGAAAAAEVYRQGGQEVLMLASGIPQGATPGDLEQTFQSLDGILPEAVGVMDQPVGGFQGNRPLSAQVVPILADAGRGLVTFDQGLNAADQEARRAALPSAMIFRRLDAEGEEAPVIRRYLDRAAFKAAQEGRVVVLGDTRPETVAVLLEWAVEGRAASVALAPVTAVMSVP